MSNILNAQASFHEHISEYAHQRKRAQMHRRSDYGHAESRAAGSLTALTVLAGSIGYAFATQSLQGADASTVANALVGLPTLAGVVGYVAHQAAPFRSEIAGSLKSMVASVPKIGSGFAKAFSGFTQSLGKLADNLGVSADARAMKAEAAHIKGILGVDSMSRVKSIAREVYGKHNANSVMHEAYWLRTGIDTAVKDKLRAGDKTPLSYNEIEMGILKNMEKANVLAKSAQESRGKINVMESVVLMVGNASRSNLDLPTGDFSKIKDDHSLKMLKARDADKGSEPSLS